MALAVLCVNLFVVNLDSTTSTARPRQHDLDSTILRNQTLNVVARC
ncbi:MAG: hypothetical protein ABSB99_01765 [Acidimicrobiales bacterium]